MEEELTIIVAAVSAYLGLPPGRINLEAADDMEFSALRFPIPGQSRQINKQLWKWSLTTAHKNDSGYIRINLEHGRSTWRQATL